jgi:SAM-dependent methyltransferase
VPAPSQPYTPTRAEKRGITPPTLNQDRYLFDAILTQAQSTSCVLDFGAGTEQFAIALRQLHLNVTAVAPDAPPRDSLITHGIPVSGSAAKLPASSFDLIYSFGALERIEQDAEALRQLHASLRPEGRLLLCVPAFTLLYSARDAKAGRLRRYSRRRLCSAVTAAGFRIERVRYMDSLGVFAALLFKLFARDAGDEHRTARKVYDRVVFPVSVWLDVLTRRWVGRNLLLIARQR